MQLLLLDFPIQRVRCVGTHLMLLGYPFIGVRLLGYAFNAARLPSALANRLA